MHNHETVWIHFDTQWILSLISWHCKIHCMSFIRLIAFISWCQPKCNANVVTHEWYSNGMYTFDITFTSHTCTTIIPFFFPISIHFYCIFLFHYFEFIRHNLISVYRTIHNFSSNDCIQHSFALLSIWRKLLLVFLIWNPIRKCFCKMHKEYASKWARARVWEWE